MDSEENSYTAIN